MTLALKAVALVVLLGGVAVEGKGLVPAPGFALASGVLVAIYLWILAKARQRLRPRL